MESINLILLGICSIVLISGHISPAYANDPLADIFVREHNKYRAIDGVPPVTWDEKVAQYARNYANSKKETCEMVHSTNSPYGECLAWSGGDMSPELVVKLWVDEKKDYDYNTNTCAPGKVCMHYTQVVWSKTTKIGCAKVRCNNNETFINCNYDPSGNWVDEKPY